MTHIGEARVIGNHAAAGRTSPAASDNPFLTIKDVLRAGVRRRAGGQELTAAQSTWDSEGGATRPGTTEGDGE
jgi:hypothetical protein